MSTIVYPRPILSTLNALAWVKLLMAAVAVALIVMQYRVLPRPVSNYMLLLFVLTWTSVIWYRCYAALRNLERRHQGEPDETMMFLFDVCLQLPIIQVLLVLAVQSLTM